MVAELREVGRDPVWDTPPLADRVLTPADFDGTPVPVEHPEAGAVTVIPFDVAFAGGRWVAYVDVPRLAAAT